MLTVELASSAVAHMLSQSVLNTSHSFGHALMPLAMVYCVPSCFEQMNIPFGETLFSQFFVVEVPNAVS